MSYARRIGTIEIHSPTVWLFYINEEEDILCVDADDSDMEFVREGWTLTGSEYGWGVKIHASSGWIVVEEPVDFIIAELRCMTELITKQMKGVLDDRERETLEEKIKYHTRKKDENDKGKALRVSGGSRGVVPGKQTTQDGADRCMDGESIPN